MQRGPGEDWKTMGITENTERNFNAKTQGRKGDGGKTGRPWGSPPASAGGRRRTRSRGIRGWGSGVRGVGGSGVRGDWGSGSAWSEGIGEPGRGWRVNSRLHRAKPAVAGLRPGKTLGRSTRRRTVVRSVGRQPHGIRSGDTGFPGLRLTPGEPERRADTASGCVAAANPPAHRCAATQ